MAKIYQLMIDREQISDLYYDKHDAKNNALQACIETMETVEIWEAEEIDGIPYDMLDWSMIGSIRYDVEEKEE